MDDGLLPEADPLIQLEVFEGPLDLLLHLVKMNEVDILDLPMELVTRQYLATLRAMGKMELPLAGEYFVMAAELLKIKSQMLLPHTSRVIAVSSDEDSGRGPDPRAELVRQLLDYQQLKASAALLEQKIDAQALCYPCLQASAPLARPLHAVDRFALMGSYSSLLQRLLERIAVGEIALDPHTVAEAIETILKSLPASGESSAQSFAALLKQGPSDLSWLAAMFIGLLELTRLGEIDIAQESLAGDILLSRRTAASVAV